jgi:hypothetical protein
MREIEGSSLFSIEENVNEKAVLSVHFHRIEQDYLVVFQ